MDRRNLLQTVAVLLGASIGSSCTRAIVSGAVLDGAPPAPVLDAEELRKIATIAELIIPQTDTPGAIAAGVPEFIHRIVAEWYTADERKSFLTGLNETDMESRARFGADFLTLASDRQASVLRALEAQTPYGARAARRRYGPFFHQMKELTVLGYYTSEIGSRAELPYRPVPGAYDGHAHVDDSGQRTP